MTGDPGCMQTRCQADRPERKREGSQGRLPAPTPLSALPPTRGAGPGWPRARAAPAVNTGALHADRDRHSGAEDVWAVRASDKEAFRSNRHGIFI